MSLAKKYGLSEEALKQMIKDGWVGCKVARHEEIYNAYRNNINLGLPKSQAVSNAAELGHVSERAVYYIIQKFE